MTTNNQELEQAIKDFQKLANQMTAEMEQGLRDGSLDKQLKAYAARQKQVLRMQRTWGYISLSLAILGVLFLIHFLLPITLLKVGIFAAWLAFGLWTTR